VRSENSPDVLILGGGVTGLTLALSLHEGGIPCRVFEAAPELKWLGVGINLLPHAVRELTELGLADRFERHAVLTREMCFYNRFGQFIWRGGARCAHGKVQARRRIRARGAQEAPVSGFDLGDPG